MTGLSLALVLLSAIAHSSWNILLKHSRNQEVFVWWLQVAIVVLLFPVAAFILWQDPIERPGWLYLVGTSLLHILYFFFLSRGYARADFSLVYPLARGTGSALVPVLGVVLLQESVSGIAIVGIALVVGGIYTVYWWGRVSQILGDPLKFLKEPGTRYALLTGLTIAGYSVWDKVGVRYVNPMLYMYLMSLGAALGLAPYMALRHGARTMRRELRSSYISIIAAGVLAFIAYSMVLSAFRLSQVSYVSPVREVGIIFSVLMGIIVLKEPFGRGRIIGSVLIALGVLLIALAP
jgi:drug/metabolite transporter (DMT)-like permease